MLFVVQTSVGAGIVLFVIRWMLNVLNLVMKDERVVEIELESEESEKVSSPTTTSKKFEKEEIRPRKVKSTPSHRPSMNTPSSHRSSIYTPSSSKQSVIKGKDLPHDAWAQSPGSREVFMSGYLYKRRRNGNRRWKRLKNVIKAMSPRRFSLGRRNSSSSVVASSSSLMKNHGNTGDDNKNANESWQRRFFELPSGKFLRYYRTHTRARRSKRKGMTRPDGAIDLSHVTSLQMSRESCGNKNIVCIIHLYFENEKENKTEKVVYSLGIDASDEADASHWFSVLQERVESCRESCKDCDDEKGDAINMTSLPLMSSSSNSSKKCIYESTYDLTQDHKNSVSEHMQHDVEPVFSFATVTVKHNLSEKEQDALRELIAIINSDVETVTLKSGETVHLNKSTVRRILSCEENPYDTLEFICQRYLRGRNFVPNTAIEAMRESIRWSLENDIATLRDPMTGLEDILECDPEIITSRHPVTISGPDFQGHGVVFKYMGAACSIKEMSRKTSLKSLVRYHIFNTERSIMNLTSLSRKHARCIEQHRVVIDAAGWNLGLFNTSSAKFLYHVAKIDQNNYIERLHSMTIINAPKTVAFCWKVVKTWLDERTTRKVNIMSSSEEWRPYLETFMPNSSIPTCYGGSSSVPDALAFSRAVNKIRGH